MRRVLYYLIMSLLFIQCNWNKNNQRERRSSELTSAIEVVNKFHCFYNEDNWNGIKGLYQNDSFEKNDFFMIKNQLINEKYEIGKLLKSRLRYFGGMSLNRSGKTESYKIVLENKFTKCQAIEVYEVFKDRNGKFRIADQRLEFREYIDNKMY